MSSDKQTNHSSNIPQDAIILMDKIGCTSRLIQDRISGVTTEFSSRFHEGLVNTKILSSYDGAREWFEDGFPSQMLKPGEQWQTGRLRLRISAEFIPDKPEMEQADRPSENSSETAIEPSLDAFRESP